MTDEQIRQFIEEWEFARAEELGEDYDLVISLDGSLERLTERFRELMERILDS